MDSPTLRQLEYFVALAARLNFRKAAEACFVSQPALSGQIAQMESQLGVTLFERGKRGVRLTADGAALLPEAEETLAASQRLCRRAESLGAPLTGPLRLGVIPTIAPYLLPKVLPTIKRAHPDLTLFLREDLTDRLIERLDAGSLDLLLLAIDIELPDLETMPLFSDAFVLAVPADHALAAAQEVRMADLDGENVLLLDEGHCLREQTLPLCEAAGLSEQSGFRASSLATVVQMVAGGLGVTLMPELALEREAVATPGLVTIPFGVEGPSRVVGLGWPAHSPRADEYRMLGDSLVAAYAATCTG